LLLFVTATREKTQKNNKQSVKLKTRKCRASIAPSPKKDQKRFGAKTENRGAPAAATKPIRRDNHLSLSLARSLAITRLHNVLKCKNKVLQRKTSLTLPRTPYLSDYPRDVSPSLTSKNPLSSKISQRTKKTNKFTDYFSPTNFQSPTFKSIARAWDTDKIK
jgi:hypothetical protein